MKNEVMKRLLKAAIATDLFFLVNNPRLCVCYTKSMYSEGINRKNFNDLIFFFGFFNRFFNFFMKMNKLQL